MSFCQHLHVGSLEFDQGMGYKTISCALCTLERCSWKTGYETNKQMALAIHTSSPGTNASLETLQF